MGRGDIKTKKGKISSGSYGVLRPHKKKKTVEVAKSSPKAKKTTSKSTAKKVTTKKVSAKDKEE